MKNDRHPSTKFGELNTSAALPEFHQDKLARTIVWTILVAMIAALVWAATTPVNEITTGAGVIRTRALLERVEHPEGGVVASLNAVTGQYVEAGATLLVFETASLEREMAKLRATRDALSAELGRLAFVLEAKGTIPDFATLDELTSEELLFWAEQSFLAAQLDLINADSRTIDSTIDVLEAQHDNLARELTILNGRLERNRAGQKSGVIALSAVEQLERESLQIERSILVIRGEITSQANAMDTNLLREAELVANRQREAALRRSEIEERVIAVALSMAEIAARIDRAEVTASVSGTIMEIAVSHPREVIAPGDVIAEIVPIQDAIEAEIEVSAGKIGAVEIGMEARLKVLSFDFTRYGEIAGRVASISPSSYQNEKGDSVFRVTIALPEQGSDLRLANKPVVPGMTVTADILSDSKKILSYLLKPLRALGDHAFSEA